MNIIITNVGRRGYLVDYFKAIPGMNGKIFTSDCDRTASGLYGNNDGHFILPKPVDDEKLYVEELLRVCHENYIGAVLPVIDPDIHILSGYKDVFLNHSIRVVVSDRNVLDICFDKLKMNDFLAKIGLHCPNTYNNIDDFYEALSKGDISFPVVLKPILGSGSVDTYILDDKYKLESMFHEGMIVQEKLEGIEFGTDTFNSFDGVPLRCVIKRKISMRSGETDKSISVHSSEMEAVLMKLARELKHIANLDCDIIVSNGIPYIIDMNPRFGGGYPATHAIGVNLVEVLYKLLNNEEVSVDIGNYEDDILVMKEIAVRSTIVHDLFVDDANDRNE